MPHTDITVTATIDPAPTEDVGDLLASFRRRLDASDVNKRTIAIYASAVDELTKFLRANGMPLTVRAIRREHIESFLIYLRDERGWKPATRNQCYRSLLQFWRFLGPKGEGEVHESPMANMDAPPHSRRPTADPRA